jgi:SAM-dependent methyltransferase
MDPRLQKRIQRYGWDRASDDYAHYWQAQLEPVQTRLLEMAALQAGEKVLDVACGDGLVSFRASDAVGPGGIVVGDDISEEMIRRAESLRAESGAENLSFLRRDAEEPVAAAHRFDAALCSLGLMYVPEPERALTAMFEALRPGGRALAAVWGERRRCGWAEVFPIVDARVKSEVCPLFFRLGTGAALEGDFRAAGFGDVRTERIAYDLNFATADEACGAALIGGPVALAYSRFDDETRDAARAEYLASIESYRRGAGYEIPGEFVITQGSVAG